MWIILHASQNTITITLVADGPNLAYFGLIRKSQEARISTDAWSLTCFVHGYEPTQDRPDRSWTTPNRTG